MRFGCTCSQKSLSLLIKFFLYYLYSSSYKSNQNFCSKHSISLVSIKHLFMNLQLTLSRVKIIF